MDEIKVNLDVTLISWGYSNKKIIINTSVHFSSDD